MIILLCVSLALLVLSAAGSYKTGKLFKNEEKRKQHRKHQETTTHGFVNNTKILIWASMCLGEHRSGDYILIYRFKLTVCYFLFVIGKYVTFTIT